MSPTVMRLLRTSTEVGVFFAGVAVGLCGALVAAAAATYLQHGPYSAWGSEASVSFFIWIFPFGPIGLIGGAMLGYGAAMQPWPPGIERRN